MLRFSRECFNSTSTVHNPKISLGQTHRQLPCKVIGLVAYIPGIYTRCLLRDTEKKRQDWTGKMGEFLSSSPPVCFWIKKHKLLFAHSNMCWSIHVQAAFSRSTLFFDILFRYVCFSWIGNTVINKLKKGRSNILFTIWLVFRQEAAAHVLRNWEQ